MPSLKTATKDGPFVWLDEALSDCVYEEDVEALAHFVFHQRLNGYSNMCLLCFHAVGDDEEGHDPTCTYLRAFQRCKGESLEQLAAKA